MLHFKFILSTDIYGQNCTYMGGLLTIFSFVGVSLLVQIYLNRRVWEYCASLYKDAIAKCVRMIVLTFSYYLCNLPTRIICDLYYAVMRFKSLACSLFFLIFAFLIIIKTIGKQILDTPNIIMHLHSTFQC